MFNRSESQASGYVRSKYTPPLLSTFAACFEGTSKKTSRSSTKKKRREKDVVRENETAGVSASSSSTPETHKRVKVTSPVGAIGASEDSSVNSDRLVPSAKDIVLERKRGPIGPAKPSSDLLRLAASLKTDDSTVDIGLSEGQSRGDFFGPRMPGTGTEIEEKVLEIVREQRKLEIESAASAGGGPKREEWMTAAPTGRSALSAALGSDMKGRGFSSKTINTNTDTSGWTASPAEQQKMQEEAARRAMYEKLAKVAAMDATSSAAGPKITYEQLAELSGASSTPSGVDGTETDSQRGSSESRSLMEEHKAKLREEDLLKPKDEKEVFNFNREEQFSIRRQYDTERRDKIVSGAKDLLSKFNVSTMKKQF